MSAIFLSVMKLFVMLFAGFIARKTGVIDKSTTKGMSGLLIKATLPAMIFASMQKEFSAELLHESFIITGLSFGIYGIYFLIALLTGKLLKTGKKDIGVYQFAIVFSNVGFMGFPVLSSVFGQNSIFYAAMFNIPFHFFIFTLGVFLITSGHTENTKFDWKLFISPGIIMTVAGFVFFIFGLKLPSVIFEPLKIIGDVTVPLSMIVVGSMLTEVHHKELMAGWKVYFISFVRLIILPVVVFLFVRIFTSNSLLISVPVVIAAMPVAVNAPLIAQEYGGNALLSSRILFVSTLLSLVTLPLVLVVLQSLI